MFCSTFKSLFNIQLAFQTVGWYVSSAVWNSLRPGVNSLDPDIQGSITNGLIDGDFSATNLALGAGQVGVILQNLTQSINQCKHILL